jgi:hypothetical protein
VVCFGALFRYFLDVTVMGCGTNLVKVLSALPWIIYGTTTIRKSMGIMIFVHGGEGIRRV